jgi:hypothetical protein
LGLADAYVLVLGFLLGALSLLIQLGGAHRAEERYTFDQTDIYEIWAKLALTKPSWTHNHAPGGGDVHI